MMQASKSIVFLGADAAYLFKFRGNLMTAFAARGYRVLAAAATVNDFDVTAYAEIGVEFHRWPIAKAKFGPVEELFAAWWLFRFLTRTRPSVIFAHTIKPFILGMIIGSLINIRHRVAMIPGLGFAFTEGVEVGALRTIVNFFAKIAYSIALHRAHVVIFQNRDDLSYFERLRLTGSRSLIGLVNGSGVDMARFSQASWPAGPPTFLMMARLLRDKGVYEFVAAARLVKSAFPEVRFILAGTPDSNPTAVPLHDIAEWASERIIEVVGHLEDPRHTIAMCHAFVLPSYREGTPRSNLEAMSMARAVITTDVPGCRDTVVDGLTGIIVPPMNAEALAAAMIELASNLETARRMGIAAQAFCRERFELSNVTASTVNLIEPIQYSRQDAH
jgi:glycosyltransferase involved in cell wall biosynthesis